MKRLLLGSVAFAVSISALPASAADLTPRLYAKAPPIILQEWNGFYAGANLGWADQRSCSTFTPQAVLDPSNDNFLAGLDVGCARSSGVIGGGQAGFNQQVGRWVWGLEGDFSGLGTKTSRNTSGVSPGGALFTANQSTTLDELATVRARFGTLVTPHTLLYVTGGLAMAHVSASGGETGPVGPPQFQGFGSVSQWTPGWTVGGGVEAKLGGPWSVKAEYLYANLSAVHYDTTQPPVNIGTGFDNIGENIGMATQVHIVRAGVNYSFGAPYAGRSAYEPSGRGFYDWTGLYAGANVGGAWGTTRSREPNTEAAPGAGPWLAFGDTINAKSSGAIGGAQAGYNLQMNAFVFGIEGDVGYLRFKGQESSSLFSGTFVSSTGGLYETIRGRLGLTWDHALFYGTGGVMIANVASGVSNPLNSPPFFTDGIIFTQKTGTQTGWVAGGGIEYAIANGWSVKGEYLHFDLGTKQVVGNCENCTAGPLPFAFDIKNSGDMVRLGINRKIF